MFSLVPSTRLKRCFGSEHPPLSRRLRGAPRTVWRTLVWTSVAGVRTALKPFAAKRPKRVPIRESHRRSARREELVVGAELAPDFWQEVLCRGQRSVRSRPMASSKRERAQHARLATQWMLITHWPTCRIALVSRHPHSAPRIPRLPATLLEQRLRRAPLLQLQDGRDFFFVRAQELWKVSVGELNERKPILHLLGAQCGKSSTSLFNVPREHLRIPRACRQERGRLMTPRCRRAK